VWPQARVTFVELKASQVFDDPTRSIRDSHFENVLCQIDRDSFLCLDAVDRRRRSGHGSSTVIELIALASCSGRRAARHSLRCIE
jgi:hypothetical protein